MVSPCAVSLIVVGSFTFFTVGCGCIVNWVLCLLCGCIFHCVLCGTARHLYCWSEFYYVEFLHYRGRIVLYALCVLLLVLLVWWCIVRCCMCATACLLRPCWEKVLGVPKLGWVVVILLVGRGIGRGWVVGLFLWRLEFQQGIKDFGWGLC